MKYETSTFDMFYKVTGIHSEDVLIHFLTFNNANKQKIVAYYSGDAANPGIEAANDLVLLQGEVDDVINQFMLCRESFITYDFWNLFDVFEVIQLDLMTLSNVSKFLRSSIVNGNYSQSIEVDYATKRNQTLSKVMDVVVNSNDPINEWVNLAIKNDLKEEDYTMKGGKMLMIVFDKIGGVTNIQSVVDNINGKNMYGMDVYQKITFDAGLEDMLSLDYDSTIKQTVSILARLQKGDNPQFYKDGVSAKDIVGNDVSALSFPILFRQIYNTFATDDTIAAISIVDVKVKQDNVFIEAEITTKYGEFLQVQVKP